MAEETINGWKPPVFYDITTNETRLATQADLDAYTLLLATYRDMRVHIRSINERHDDLQNTLNRSVGVGKAWNGA